MIPIETVSQKRVPTAALLDHSHQSDGTLGAVLASSRKTMAGRVSITLIMIVAVTLPYLAWMEGAKMAAIVLWSIMILLWLLILASETKALLSIHEHGILRRRLWGTDSIRWTDIDHAVVSYSYSLDPRAMFRVDIVATNKRKYGLGLNWKNRKALIAFLDKALVPEHK